MTAPTAHPKKQATIGLDVVEEEEEEVLQDKNTFVGFAQYQRSLHHKIFRE